MTKYGKFTTPPLGLTWHRSQLGFTRRRRTWCICALLALLLVSGTSTRTVGLHFACLISSSHGISPHLPREPMVNDHSFATRTDSAWPYNKQRIKHIHGIYTLTAMNSSWITLRHRPQSICTCRTRRQLLFMLPYVAARPTSDTKPTLGANQRSQNDTLIARWTHQVTSPLLGLYCWKRFYRCHFVKAELCKLSN